MPDDRIEIKITADASGFTAGTQQATAAMGQMRVSAAELRAAMGGTTSIGNETLKALTGVGAAAQTAGAAMNVGATAAKEAATATEGLRVATAGSMREIMIGAHEIMTGNFSRLPGTVMVAAERMGALHQIVAALTPTMYAAGAAAAVFGAGVFAIAKNTIEADRELRALQGQMLLLGRGADLAAAQKDIDGLRSTFDLSRAEAAKVVTTIQGIPRATDDARGQMERFAVAIAMASRGTVEAPKAAELMAKAIEGGRGGIEKFGETWNLFSAEQITALKSTQNTAQATDILLAALSDRFKIAEDRAKGLAAVFQSVRSGLGFGAETPMIPKQQQNVPALATGPAPNEGRLQLLDVEDRYNASLVREQQIKKDIATLDAAIVTASAGDETRLMAERAKAVEELKSLEQKQQGSTLATFRATLASMQADFAGTHIQMLGASASMWKAELGDAKLTVAEKLEAERGYSQAVRALRDAETADATRVAKEETQARTESYRAQMEIVRTSNAEALAIIRLQNNGSRSDELKADTRYWMERVRLAQKGTLEEIQAMTGLARAQLAESNQAVQQWTRAWNQVTQPFNGFVRSVLSGTQTIGSAMKQMWAQVAISAVESIGKTTLEYVASSAIQLAIGKTMASSQILTHAKSAAAAVYDDVAQIPYVGWILAPAAAAAAFAAVSAFGSFDKGTGLAGVPHDMLAMVHQGEIIIPPAQSAAIRSSAASGGGSPSFPVNITALDARSVQQLFANPSALDPLVNLVLRRLGQRPSVQGAYL